jgi:hypothetical protein
MSQYYIKVKSCESAPNAEPEYWSRQIVSPTQSNLFWNDGHVGIGAPNPLAMLQVDGNVGIGTAYSTKKPPVDGLIVSGNMGVGTFEPEHKLHVIGNARIEGNLIVNGSQTIIDTDVQTTERLDITNNGTGPALRVNQVGANDVIDIQDSGVSVLKILDGGNVGIGTDNPQAKLHVNGSVSIPSGMLLCPGILIGHGFNTYQTTFNITGLTASWTNTNLSVNYTPKSNNSKIYAFANFQYQAGNSSGSGIVAWYVNIHRTVGGGSATPGSANKFFHDAACGQNDWSSMTVMDTWSNTSTSTQTFALYVKEYAGTTRGTFHNGSYGISIISVFELAN